MATKKIKQVGRAQAVAYMRDMEMADMREATTHAEKTSYIDMVAFVRKRDPSLTLADASALAKGVHAYLNETE